MLIIVIWVIIFILDVVLLFYLVDWKKKVWRCDYYFIIGILVCVWKDKYMVKLEIFFYIDIFLYEDKIFKFIWYCLENFFYFELV